RLDPRVREAILPLLEEDPRASGGLLSDARRARDVLASARERTAALIGADPSEVVFTSGGTEACNLALKGVALARLARGSRRGRILVCATEHSAVLYPARTLAKLGFECLEVPVNRHGVIDLDALSSMLGAGTFLVSVAAANAETGTLQPMAEIARIVHERGALLHTDACVAAAYRPFDVCAAGCDLASFSAHKIGGPRGSGALYVRRGVRLLPLIEGGTEEGGLRGGAPYIAGAAGFGAAARFLAAELPDREARMAGLGSRLLAGLGRIEGLSHNGHPERRLHALVNVSASGVDGEALLLRLARAGVAASSGSSCVSDAGKPSHVLLAMGVPRERAQGSVLFAVGPDNTAAEIERVARLVPDAVAALRSIAAGPPG
ncbi:MAG TPA: cysteine desulfurase family protein, partial [Candidatus Polarisedimenticolia bacterium]|nr:cysteine desulfurase family protein [Candidatus Polarisedimenticolia bacterium]